MTRKSRFIIRRKDKVIQSDDLVMEKEDLTIGRFITHDLVLNHGSVSRLHAGIREVEGVFWLFNLSRSNGTLLNGQIVDKSPLADNDEIQIGPFLLKVGYSVNGFLITVDVGQGTYVTDSLPSGGLTQTIQIAMPGVPGEKDSILSTATRTSGSGFIKAYLPDTSNLALNLYWSKRKREAGKIDLGSRLAPTGNQKVGKAQFFWRPTLDLKKLWRKSYFINAAVMICSLSVLAWFLYESVFSRGGFPPYTARPRRRPAIWRSMRAQAPARTVTVSPPRCRADARPATPRRTRP
ncbi:MAG TPA: FHA domain-containing protein [Blastocatellia bacterium]|nr:FHA domain-containing protein [Blastocatellia bacterium]